MNEYEQELLNKIDNGEKLDESELKFLIFECEVVCNEGDSGRWSQSVETISLLGDRYFSIEWEEGLTECQESYFPYQPVEVKPVKYMQMKTVTEYIGINEDETKYKHEHDGVELHSVSQIFDEMELPTEYWNMKYARKNYVEVI